MQIRASMSDWRLDFLGMKLETAEFIIRTLLKELR
jgi:hypothetical protein